MQHPQDPGNVSGVFVQRKCLTEEGFRLGHGTGPADDAAQQAEGVCDGELVAEQALLGEALLCALPALFVIACRPVDQGQPGQCVACSEVVTEFVVLGQRPAEVFAGCRVIARQEDRGEAEVVVSLRDPVRRACPGADGQRFLEALPR